MRELSEIATPALILERDRVVTNCERMLARSRALGVSLRPHMKTAKCVEIARLASAGGPCIAVSTVAEAAYFAQAGFGDILYAVGIVPQKLSALADIQRSTGARLTIILDRVETAQAVVAMIATQDQQFDILIEIDCGAGRGGVEADGPELQPIADILRQSVALNLKGVLSHAGHSYTARSVAEIMSIAEQERIAVVHAAAELRNGGHVISVVSVGSTPTAICGACFDGVTEIRPGVYMLFDLDQVALGVCERDEIALTVLATVIGANPRSQRLLIDAGALAVSKDRGVAFDQMRTYGAVCLIDGTPLPGVWVDDVHQEHGFVATSGDFGALAARLPVGERIRILPNHVCLTAAAFDRYHLVSGAPAVIGEWSKLTGW